MFRSLRSLGKILNPVAGWATPRVSPRDTQPETSAPPATTIFHITHHKAGSQWINRIFHALAYDRLVMPKVNGTEFNIQFLNEPLIAGKIYPTLYVTKQQFESVKLPPNSKHFVVIRDLRDTLISAYFSIKHSHEMGADAHLQLRARLREVSVETGLKILMNVWLPDQAAIQQSWIDGPDELLKYEELLAHDEEILERVLLNQCQLSVSRGKLGEVILANRFESRTNGRRRGEEDVASHERKGIAGDWKNYFTDQLAKEFQSRYGELLVDTAYEPDCRW